MEEITIGILGGSGLYDMAALKNISEIEVDTIYGKTSDAIITGDIDGVRVAFMPRHGRSHSLSPSEVPYKANIYAMKKIGVRYLLSVSAVGSLREEMKPRDVVILNQYIDHTKNRDMSFFGNGMVAHVSMAQPTCQNLNEILAEITNKLLLKNQCPSDTTPSKDATPNEQQIKVHRGGTYLCIEGPQFSSFAESNLFRLMGADIIGMTNMPEAKLAREAQIAYSSMAMVTDYDCWHPNEEAVNVDMLLENLKANSKLSQDIIQEAVGRIFALQPSSIAHNALAQAILTPIETLNDEQKNLMELLMK